VKSREVTGKVGIVDRIGQGDVPVQARQNKALANFILLIGGLDEERSWILPVFSRPGLPRDVFQPRADGDEAFPADARKPGPSVIKRAKRDR